jgi:hypothetical protein
VILVVSYPGEDHTVDVVRRLEALGREVVLIDLSDFPSRAGVALEWRPGERPAYVLDRLGERVDLAYARVVWWRRVRPHQVDPGVTDPTLRAFALSETTQAVQGMLDALPCVWVNPRGTDDTAHHKPLQWTVACQVGLRVPRTLVTNRPEAARAFLAELGIGRVVFKAFLAMLEAWRETRLATRQDLERLELVRYAPVIFQEYVEGVDVRITVVGEQVFAAEIDARRTSYPFDMRMALGEANVKPVSLPEEVHDGVLRLQRRLGLVYGAIDMRRTAAGDWVFFEVNPAGQWLFVEQRTGLPISQAVAALLARLDGSPEKGGA